MASSTKPVRRLVGFGLLALVVGGMGLGVYGCATIEQWFAPSAVVLREAYAADREGPQFDHGRLDAVLTKFVAADGRVDYAGLRRAPQDLDAYLEQLAMADFRALPRDEKLAFLINAYNACTLRLILDHWPVASIQDIPAAKRWDDRRWRIGGEVLSLSDIEHGYLRSRFREPRIHFAINCASVGCPPLRREAYRGARIEAQLQEQTLQLHGKTAFLNLNAASGSLDLTRLYLWYEGDFEQVSGTALQYAARFHPQLAAALEAGRRPAVRWIAYDWAINSRNP